LKDENQYKNNQEFIHLLRNRFSYFFRKSLGIFYPSNLDKITPAEMDFKITNNPPDKTY
jgi:hypothetical protein